MCKLSLPTAIHTGHDLCLKPGPQGLKHMHDQGIVHGDIKPDNVLLGGVAGCALSDFGCGELTRRLANTTMDRVPKPLTQPPSHSPLYPS